MFNTPFRAAFPALHLPALGRYRETGPFHNKLAAYWKLDEASGNALDATGHGNTLTAVNNPLADTGVLGNARLFVAASSQYLTRPTTGGDYLTLGDTDWTLTCWVRLTSGGGNQLVVTKHSPNTSGEFAIMIAGDRSVMFILYGPAHATAGLLTSTGVLALAAWYFLAFRHDSVNNLMHLTINTTHKSLATLGPVDSTADYFRIGTQNPTTYFFDGRIDEVGVWKRLLTNAELAELA